MACKALETAGRDIVGLNCSRGPHTILPLLDRVRSAVACSVAVQPVPYHTTASEPTLGPCFFSCSSPLYESLRRRFRPRMDARSFSSMTSGLSDGTKPHHNFHVFEVYRRAGLLRDERATIARERMDQCRIIWGRVACDRLGASAFRALSRATRSVIAHTNLTI